MKNFTQILSSVISVSITLTSMSSLATAAVATRKILCHADQGAIKVEALVSSQKMTAKISDFKNTLSIRELSIGEAVDLPVVLRKKESQYRFAKFYVDFNAWQDLEFSVPKDLFNLQKNTHFASYLVVSMDNGDIMAPQSTTKLSCLIQ